MLKLKFPSGAVVTFSPEKPDKDNGYVPYLGCIYVWFDDDDEEYGPVDVVELVKTANEMLSRIDKLELRVDKHIESLTGPGDYK